MVRVGDMKQRQVINPKVRALDHTLYVRALDHTLYSLPNLRWYPLPVLQALKTVPKMCHTPKDQTLGEQSSKALPQQVGLSHNVLDIKLLALVQRALSFL